MALLRCRLSNTDRVSFNHILRTCFLLIVCCVFAGKANAQDTTRVVKPSTRSFTEYDIDRNKTWEHIDTGFNRLEIVQPTFRKDILFQDLGNFGSPNRPLLFEVNRKAGFQYALNPFDIYTFKAEEARYINTKTPFTDLYYSQGPNEMLYLKASHSQNIRPRWNVGIDYQRITSQGYLLRQYTSIYNVQAFTSYQSKDRRYMLLANATWNRALAEESGGILNDSAFEVLTGKSKEVDVRLTNAQSYMRNRSARVKQYWNFGAPKYQYRDEDTLYDFQNRSHLSYTFHAEQSSFTFKNIGSTDTTLLPHQYYDIIGNPTYDSAYFGKMENKLELNLFTDKDKQLEDSVRRFVGASLMHQQVATAQIQFIRNYYNIIADIAFENIALKNNTLSYSAYGAYTLAGFNSTDFKANGVVRYRTRIFDLSANGLIQLFRPDYTYLFFKSNQFIWNNNNFDQTGVTQIGGALSTRTFKNNATLKVNQYAIQNWAYASADGTPAQQSGSIFVTTATLSKTFKLWKFFLEHELIYQNCNSNVIRVPEFGGMARYYFASRLFKALKFQLGFSVFYNTAYYGNAYNPATRFFYLQSDTKIGNYPVVDPFFIGEVKRAAFFVKMEHLNQDWSNQGGYYTPHYPLSLQSLRLGVRWRFFD
jgi:hypothetical protein